MDDLLLCVIVTKRKIVTHGVVLSSIIVRGLITEKGDGDGR